MDAAWAAAIWVLGLLMIVEQVGRHVTRWLDLRAEAQVAALRQAEKPVLPKPQPMPLDLRLAVGQYRDKWAQQQAAERAQELYAELGDWDKVGAALMVDES